MSDSVYEEILEASLPGLYEQARAGLYEQDSAVLPAPRNPKHLTLKPREPKIRDVVITRDNDIKLPHNIQIKERLLDLFEQMSTYYEYFCYRTMLLAGIRRAATTYSTSVIGVKYSTPWGEFMLKETLKMSQRKELALEALSRMGISSELEFTKFNRYIIVFETGGIGLYPNAIKTFAKITKEFHDGTWDKTYQSNVTGTPNVAITPNMVFATKAMKWIRDHEYEISQYRTLYNQAKDLFKMACYNGRSEKPDGKFPRMFAHNKINMYWKDVTHSSNFAQRLSAYFIEDQQQHTKYKEHLKTIWKERNEQRLASTRDGYDHEQYDESDYDN